MFWRSSSRPNYSTTRAKSADETYGLFSRAASAARGQLLQQKDGYTGEPSQGNDSVHPIDDIAVYCQTISAASPLRSSRCFPDVGTPVLQAVSIRGDEARRVKIDLRVLAVHLGHHLAVCRATSVQIGGRCGCPDRGVRGWVVPAKIVVAGALVARLRDVPRGKVSFYLTRGIDKRSSRVEKDVILAVARDSP